jgi:hypothetical protein
MPTGANAIVCREAFADLLNSCVGKLAQAPRAPIKQWDQSDFFALLNLEFVSPLEPGSAIFAVIGCEYNGRPISAVHFVHVQCTIG